MRRAFAATLTALALASSGVAGAWAASAAHKATTAAVPMWSVDKSQSKIRFRSSFGGTAFEGGFSRFDAQIAFDPKNLAGSRVVVTVDLASAGSGDQDRDSALPTADWFDVGKAPRAVFATTGFKDLGGGRFLASGTLAMRGVMRPVSLPFTLAINGTTARMTGQVVLNRSQFGVGQGQFKSAETVPFEVAVPIVLVAKRAG